MPGRPWTQDEDAWLARHIARWSWHGIQSYLRRSRRAIEQRATYLRLRKVGGDRGYTLADVAGILGLDRDTQVREWVRRGWLRATRRGTDHPRDPWYVSRHDLRTFFVRRADEIHLGRIETRGDKSTFIELLSRGGRGAGGESVMASGDSDPKRLGRRTMTRDNETPCAEATSKPREHDSISRADRRKRAAERLAVQLPPFRCGICNREWPAVTASGRLRVACPDTACSTRIAGMASAARRMALTQNNTMGTAGRTPEDSLTTTLITRSST